MRVPVKVPSNSSRDGPRGGFASGPRTVARLHADQPSPPSRLSAATRSFSAAPDLK